MNNIINSSGIYDINAYNLTTNKATVLSTLNVAGHIFGSGTGLSNLNYGSINNPPDLTVYNAWTKITGTSNIYNTGSYGKVGINTTTPQAALEVVGYNNSYRIKFGTTLSTGTPMGANRIYSNGLFRFLSTYYTDEIATFHRIDNYDDPINAIEYFSIKTSGVNVTANLNISGTTTLINNTTCMSSLNVSGFTTLNDNTTLSSSLNVSGTTTLSNNTTLSSSLNVSGTTTLNNNTTLSSSLNVSGLTTLSNNTTCISSFNVSGTAILNNIATCISSLNVSGTAILNNATTCISSFNVSGVTTLKNNTTCISSLNVSGITTLSNNVNINTVTNLARLTLRMSYNDGYTGGLCIDSSDGQTYNLRLFSYVQVANQVGYNFQVNNISSSVNALTFDYDGGVNINKLRIGNKSIYNNLFNSGGFGHETLTNFDNITDFGYRFINTPATNGPGTPSTPANQYYSWFIGLGTTYNYNTYGAQFALPRKTANPILSIRYLDDGGLWGGWTGITAEALTSGNKSISGNLTVNNITLASNGKINCVDDYHYIQLDQTTDTLTLQEYGTITFNIGPTKTQRIFINSIGLDVNNTLNVSGLTILNNATTLSSSLNVSGFTTLSNNTTCISSLNVSGFTTLNNFTTLSSSLNVSGTTTLNNYTIINGNTQLQPKILLSGQEYLIAAQTATDGVALLLGATRVNNRLLFIGDSAKLTQNTTNPIVSINPTGRFDCTSTDGSLRLPAVFNGAIFTDATYNTTLISSLNISGFTLLNNITTINSSLNVSGYTTLSGGNITGKILMSGTVVNDHSLQVKNPNYTAPLLQLDAGISGRVTANTNPRAIGKVLLGVGGRGCTAIGDYYAIGLGYLFNPTEPYCCEIGCVITDYTDREAGDLLFSTRTGTTPSSVASERMRIKSDGTITINNNTTLFSALNVSGVTTLSNATTCLSSLNVSGNTTLSGNTYNTGSIGINTSSLLARLTVKMSYSDGNTGGLCIDSGDGTTYNLRLFSYVQAGGQVGYKFQVNNIGSSNEALILGYDGSVSIPGYLYAGGFTSGIRINGNDYGNTFYQNAVTIGGQAANIGFTLRDANTFNFNSLSSTGGGYTTLMSMNTNTINLNTTTKINSYLGVGITNPSLNPLCKLDVQGVTNLRGGSPYSVPNNMMTPGSLCIGSIDTDYGYATGWSTNTAGIMMECSNITEICVHDSGTRVASLLYYYGPTNQIYIGRDKGWGYSNVFMSGYLQCLFYSISNAGTDYVGVANADGNNNLNYSRQLFLMFNTFTGFHRCFTDDIEFKEEDQQKFKDDYVGRIVVSSGKIATDLKKIDDEEWTILYDKEGITIEDSLPIIRLSRTKKDKRVFGVLGMASRNNSRAKRMIVNSVGEGAMWICNSNGNIENGDYITSSDYLGYGEKQDDDLLHNYTVGKATIDCNFELDSPFYNCLELNENIKIAFIAVTYHCGK